MVPAAITQLSLRQSLSSSKSLSHPTGLCVGLGASSVVVLVFVVVVVVVVVVVLVEVVMVDAIVG